MKQTKIPIAIKPMQLVQQVRKTNASWKGRPSDFQVLGHELGVISVQEKPISVEGMSLKMPRGFRITLNSRSHPPTRKRFSWAHELGHIYIAEHGQAPVGPIRHDNKKLERYCDELASEFLMPYELFTEDMSLKPVSLVNAIGLARTYQTSATAAAIRYVNLSPVPLALIRWDRDRRNVNYLKLRWQVHSTHSGPRLDCRWKPNRLTGPSFVGAEEAYTSAGVIDSIERVLTNSRSGLSVYTNFQNYRVESKGFGTNNNRFVLSMVHL